MTRLWLSTLPSTDPAFEPLNRAAAMCDDTEWPLLWNAHQQAIADAAWGHDLNAMDARAKRMHENAADSGDLLEAMGYALGVTAVRVAIREQHETADLAEVA